MSYIEDDVPVDEMSAMAEALEADMDRALGEAMDLAADIKLDFEKKGAFWQYIGTMRAAAIEAIKGFDEIDATDVAGIIRLQVSLKAYKAAVRFAVNQMRPYSSPTSDSDEETDGPSAD